MLLNINDINALTTLPVYNYLDILPNLRPTDVNWLKRFVLIFKANERTRNHYNQGHQSITILD